jgi:TolB-like protein|tara:strand:+ start:648 stop:1832 length:1185 start_codon:yes stop_codon:yes gene_type:complete
MAKRLEKTSFGPTLKLMTVGSKKLKKVTKITAPITGVFGVLIDFMSPMAPLAPIIFILMICIFLYCFMFKVRPIIKSTGFDSAIENKFTYAATFSLVGSLIMLFFWGGSLIYPDEGVVAGNFSAVKDFQQRVLGTMDEISEKQDVIIEKQDKMADDVTDIKEIMTGEAEIKQLASTEDYSTFEEVNVRTDITDQKTIAILYFDNSSGNSQLDALKKGLADMLISDLSNLQMLRVVEREKLEEVMAELKLSSGREFDAGTRQKLGKLLGAETILFGSYFEMIGKFRIDARIVKTETGEILKSEGVNGVTADFMTLEKQLVWKIARGLDIRFTEKEEATIMASESVSYEATLIYADGLKLYDSGDKPRALEKFKEAVALAPNFDRAKQMIGKLSQI